MRPLARLMLLLAVAAVAVGAALELAGVEGRAVALSVAAAALTILCVIAATDETAEPMPAADEAEQIPLA